MSGKRKRNEKCVNWTREKIIRLIELYESHSNLWDCSSATYRKRSARMSSIGDISKKLEISVEDIKEKIHNLRCQQFQNLNRKYNKKYLLRI